MKHVLDYWQCIQRGAVVRVYCTGDKGPSSFERAVARCRSERANFVASWADFAQDDPNRSQWNGDEAADRFERGLSARYGRQIDLWLALAETPPSSMDRSICRSADAQD